MNLKDKTLVILTPAFPPDESPEESPWVPAVQIFIKAINRNFPDLEVIVLVFKFPECKKEYTWFGNQIIPLSESHFGKISTLKTWFLVWRRLRSLKKNKKVIGIISFWCSECCLIGSYFGRLNAVRHLCWISGQDAKKENGYVKFIRPQAYELVAMSDFLADEFYKNHRIRPSYIIPDGIDAELFPKINFERTIDILAAGSFILLKRYDLFVDIIHELKSSYPDIKVCLCGDGIEENKLRTQIQDLNLVENIYLTGLLPQQEVLKLMKKSRVFLHTSEYEGFGNVCIEALYAGCHVISFTKPMNRDIKNWQTVNTKDEMVSMTHALLEDADLKFDPVFPFDMNESAKKFMELLML